MSKRLRNLTGLINEGRSRAPSMLSLFASASLSAAEIAEQAVLGVEGADREDLEKGISTICGYALFEVAKIAHDLQRTGVFRECARARDETFVTLLSECHVHIPKFEVQLARKAELEGARTKLLVDL